MDIFRSFSDGLCASSSSCFTAIRLPGLRRDFLAKGVDGAPVFLLHDISEARYFPGVHSKYLSAHFHATCQIHTDNSEMEGQFALVSCDGAESDLHEIFVRCFAAAIEELPFEAQTPDLNRCVYKLLDLFKALSEPSSKKITGLWAELYTVANSESVGAALEAWHDRPGDRYDFSWGGNCLEVKATTQMARMHQFALEQLMSPVGGEGYVASFLLQPLSGGLSVLDLATRIEDQVRNSPALKQKLWRNVAKALGGDFSDKVDKRFDVSYAERFVMVFLMENIPKVREPTDPRVLSIRFTADLTTVASSLTTAGPVTLRRMFAP